ncbi:hypothetical protein CI102_14217 [Trichoderma harzianum]|nr:hypothetical protein CI102_14217 [Trichoderma harzianum]
MDNTNKEQIYVQELDDILSPVFQKISRIITDPNIQWEQMRSKKVHMQQCLDDTLISLTTPLTQTYFNISIIKIASTQAKIRLSYSGDIIPLSECSGCDIYDGKKTHQLVFGKKLHLPQKQLGLFMGGECDLYLLWLFKSKEDLP